MLRLALALHATQGELLDRLTSEELTEWMVYDAMEPIGQHRLDYGFGILSALVANVNRKKGGKPFRPIDFMPFLRDPDEGKTMMHDTESALAFFETLAAMTGEAYDGNSR